MRQDGTPVGFVDVLIRNTVRVVDFLPALYFLGGVVFLIQRQGKRIGDLAAGTVVVKLRTRELPAAITPTTESVSPTPPEDLLALVRPAAYGISTEEAAAIRRFLDRRSELAPDVRRRMAGRMLEAVRAKLPDEAVAAAGRDVEVVLEALAYACAQTGERF